MNTHTIADALRRRGTRLLLGAACAAALTSTVLSVPVASAATHRGPALSGGPTSFVVGTGTVNCKAETGEVGFAPPSIKGGIQLETISIWFVATDCGGGSPTPTSVIGSMSFTVPHNTCPLLGTFTKQATLNLTYDYPPVPNPLIDPSVATSATVKSGPGPYWTITSSHIIGSYPISSPTVFKNEFYPTVVAPGNCTPAGVTDMYINRTQGFIANF